MSKTPSILSAVNKLRVLISREEKFKWIGIVGFAVITSILELITASVVIIFAQILNQPKYGSTYFNKIGFVNLSESSVVLYSALFLAVIYIIKNLISIAEVFFQNFSIEKMSHNFKDKLLNAYSNAKYEFYISRNSSNFIQIISSDADMMFYNGITSMVGTISESLVFITLICMIVYIKPSLAVVIFTSIILISIVVTKFVLPKFYKFGQNLQISHLKTNHNLTQFFHGFKEIILLGKKRYFIDLYNTTAIEKSNVQAIKSSFNILPRIVIEIIFVLMFVTAIVVLCLDNEKPGQMMGILGGYIYVGFRIMPGINRMISHLNLFKSVIPSIEHLYNEYTTFSSTQTYVDVPDFQFSKSIDINNVNFRYSSVNRYALKNINISIKKGDSIGIVGETGSGKSTLLDLILGLLTPENGYVLIDELYPVNSCQWHSKIGYVPQSIYLVDDTIASNIAFGEEVIDMKRLNDAIDAAQLRTFIGRLEDGVETVVGERGVRLSGGERQRIAIARALYRNPEVLIFDEATSALDNKTELELMSTIKIISANRTIIMIAHRVTTLKDCNRIIMIDKGEVKADTDYASIKEILKH